MQTSTSGTAKYTNPVLYLAGILLFLLPFVEIKCNNVSVAQNTGIGLATGSDFKTVGELRSMQDSFEERTDTESKSTKGSGKLYAVALISLILGSLGFLISIMGNRSRTTHILIGLLAAVALIVLMIQLQIDVQDQAGNNDHRNNENPFGEAKVTASFTAWYYLSLLCFLGLAFYNYLQRKKSIPHETPPKNAPQIPIENPGDQSEFPNSASESEIG